MTITMSGRYATARTRSAARRLADALETAEDLDVAVWHAKAAQGSCVIVVESLDDAAALAQALGAEPRRFGWIRERTTEAVWADPAESVSVVIELDGRPEIGPLLRG